MAEHRRIRIEVVIEELGLPTLTVRLAAAGARGWSVVPSVTGSGRQGAREPDHVAGISGNALVFLLVEPDEVDELVAVATEVVERFSGLVMTHPVTVHTP